MTRSILHILVLVAFLGITGSAQSPPAAGDQKPPDQKPGDEKPFAEVVKDMQALPGLFPLYRNSDDNRVLMEIAPAQLDKVFLLAATVDRGIGERGIYGSQVGDDFPFMLKRVGKSIQFVRMNTSFTAAGDTPQARATQRSFVDAILGAAKIQSKPHPERQSVLVDVADLFVTDLPALVPRLNRAYEPTSYKFDKATSAIGTLKNFLDNTLLQVTLHYTTDNPRTPSSALADRRSIPVVVAYDLSALRPTAYRPRIADDRVGHFLTVHQDFTSDHPSVPYRRYVTRWHLEKADPSAPLSPPRQPIVFWLENTIPVEYRPYFTDGVLLWNKAFERIGFKDAILVKQQPDDAAWDAADTRYNTIRWFAGVDASFAIGPSRANPFTGEIYDADISVSDGIIRNARRGGEELVAPTLPSSPSGLWNDGQHQSRFACDYADGLAHQAAFGFAVLAANEALSPEVETRLMREYIVDLIAHEVGHTLGLRHNFRASTMLKLADLHDLGKTTELGQSASVMDYNPIVLAGKGRPQGHFLPVTLGAYDYWAIEYAYKVIGGDETKELAAIASRVADPALAYSTDEDAVGTFSPRSIDPRANQYDQSTDPIAYFRERIGIIHELWRSMDTTLPRRGEGYQVLRRALARSFNEYNRGLLTSSKDIGGIYHHRDHVADPNGRLPFVVVPAARQREALDFLREFAFSERAFRLPASLHRKLAVERLPGVSLDAFFSSADRIDYPYHEAVIGLQRAVLTRLFDPITLSRIQDNELLFAAGEKPFTMADLFQGLTQSMWSELSSLGQRAAISSLRRNLQREHLRQLVRLVVRPEAPRPAGAQQPPAPRAPEDARTLAYASLGDIRRDIRQLLNAGQVRDATTRAHLQETSARITSTLQAHVERTID